MNINMPGINTGALLKVGKMNNGVPEWITSDIPVLVTDWGLQQLHTKYLCNMSETVQIGDSNNSRCKQFVGSQFTNIIKGTGFTIADINKSVLYKDGTVSLVIGYINNSTIIVESVKTVSTSKMYIVNTTTDILDSVQLISNTVIASEEYVSNNRSYDNETGLLTITNTRCIQFEGCGGSYQYFSEIGISCLDINDTSYKIFGRGIFEPITFLMGEQACVEVTLYRTIYCKEFNVNTTYLTGDTSTATLKFNMEADIFSGYGYYSTIGSDGTTIAPYITGTVLERNGEAGSKRLLSMLSYNSHPLVAGNIIDTRTNIIADNIAAIDMQCVHDRVYVLTTTQLQIYSNLNNVVPTCISITIDNDVTKMFIANINNIILVSPNTLSLYKYDPLLNTISSSSVDSISFASIVSENPEHFQDPNWEYTNVFLAKTNIENGYLLIDNVKDIISLFYIEEISGSYKFTISNKYINGIGDISEKAPTFICCNDNNRIAVGCNTGRIYIYDNIFQDNQIVNTIDTSDNSVIETMLFVSNNILLVTQSETIALYQYDTDVPIEILDTSTEFYSTSVPIKLWDSTIFFPSLGITVDIVEGNFLEASLNDSFRCTKACYYNDNLIMYRSPYYSMYGISKAIYYKKVLLAEECSNVYQDTSFNYNMCSIDLGIFDELNLTALAITVPNDAEDYLTAMFHVIFNTPISGYNKIITDFKLFTRWGRTIVPPQIAST